MHNMLKTVFVALPGAILITACSTTPTSTSTPLGSNAGSNGNTGKPDSRTVSTVNVTSDPLNDPKGLLAKRSVYFDFDSYTPKQEFTPLIESHAKYLDTNKQRKVVIQGNTDERGGTEYNLALGQKRAEAVRKELVLLGVPGSQLEAISFGKEKPKALGNDEASWAENRRADIVYSNNR